MKYIHTYSEETAVSQVALGCMRIGGMNEKEADTYMMIA